MMKNFALVGCLLGLFFSTTIAFSQENPLLKLLGTWEVEFYKTEPEGLLEQPGFNRNSVFTAVLTPDKKGIIQTNRIHGNGVEELNNIVHFYDSEKNEGHLLGAFGTGVTTFPDANSIVVKQFTFSGKSMGIQKVTFKSENETGGTMEFVSGDQPIKIWVRAKKKE